MGNFLYDFFDTTSLIITFVFIILGILFFMFRKSSKMLRHLKLILVILVIGLCTFTIFKIYEYNNGFEIEENYEYVYGRISYIGNNRIKIYSTNSSYDKNGKGNIVIKVNKNTEVRNNYIKDNNLSINDLKVGDTIRVFCKEKEVKNNFINAVKIIVIQN